MQLVHTSPHFDVCILQLIVYSILLGRTRYQPFKLPVTQYSYSQFHGRAFFYSEDVFARISLIFVNKSQLVQQFYNKSHCSIRLYTPLSLSMIFVVALSQLRTYYCLQFCDFNHSQLFNFVRRVLYQRVLHDLKVSHNCTCGLPIWFHINKQPAQWQLIRPSQTISTDVNVLQTMHFIRCIDCSIRVFIQVINFARAT